MMKKSFLAFVVCLLTSAAPVWAAPVTDTEAALAARGWSLLNGKAFGALGEVLSVETERDAAGEVLWYVVRMQQGAVIASPDSEVEPVMAVLPGSDGVIPEKSPLRAMLNRDLPQRLAYARALKAAPGAAPSSTASKWTRLTSVAGVKFAPGASPVAANGNTPATVVRWLDGWNAGSTVGDQQTLRFWDQSRSTAYFKNSKIFNLYTPGNAVCGCVATAGAAVMHYFRAPRGNVVTTTCSYQSNKVKLTTKGGEYDWSLIDSKKLIRDNPIQLDEKTVDLLGRVTYDCGVGCMMMYDVEKSGSSAAYTFDLRDCFVRVFGARNAQYVAAPENTRDIGAETYPKLIYHQIRAGAPVVMGIDGHSVVACGYGYDSSKTDYTYVFLGWSGKNDAWYALPVINTKATAEGGLYESRVLDQVLTEISFSDKYIAVVGRVLDVDGKPVADSPVKMGNGEVVRTNAKGFWGARVSPTDPCYVTDEKGMVHAYTIGHTAESTETWRRSNILTPDLPDAIEITLRDPAIEVYDGSVFQQVYGTLDAAVERAKTLKTPRLHLIRHSECLQPVTFDFDCTISATDEASSRAIVRAPGAMLTVKSGVTLTLENVAFSASDEKLVTVEAGARLVLGAGTDLGVNIEQEAVETADANGIVLAGRLARNILLRVATASAVGETFGTYTCAEADAAAAALMIVNAADENREVRGLASSGKLIWKVQNVPFEDAVGYFVVGDATNAYGRLDRVFERYAAALAEGKTISEIVVRKLASLASPIDVSAALTVRGEPGAAILPTAAARFTVGSGGALTLADITFRDYLGPRLFQVSGGDLTLSSGTCLTNLISSDAATDMGGVTMLSAGTLTMKSGASIIDCHAIGSGRYGTSGGGLYVAGGTLRLQGGLITGCSALKSGGGVAVGSARAVVELAGDIRIIGNQSAGEALDDNLFISAGTDGNPLRITASLAPVARVGIGGYEADIVEGESFATFVSGLSEGDRAAAARAFEAEGENSEGLYAQAVSEDGEDVLVWGLRDVASGGVSPDAAYVLVVYPDGTTNYFDTVEDAFDSITGDCEVFLQDDKTVFVGNLTVSHQVTLRPGAGHQYADLFRVGLCQVKVRPGGTLTIRDVGVHGYYSFEGNLYGCADTLIDVSGGALTLADGARLDSVLGDGSWAASAVSVSGNGTFTMEEGALISDCQNDWLGAGFEKPPTSPEEIKEADVGRGAGLLLYSGTAYLRGGAITDCRAAKGGGVYLANGTTAYVSGSFSLDSNTGYDLRTCEWGRRSNLEVDGKGRLVLCGELTGSVGVSRGTEMLGSDTNTFGSVDSSAELESLRASAEQFFRDDRPYVKGLIVTNGTEALLVWADAIRTEDGASYYESGDGTRYGLVGDAPPPVVPPDPPVVTNWPSAIAFKSIERLSKTAWTLTITNRVPWCHYRLLATDDLAKGFVITGRWEQVDETVDPVWTTNVTTTGGACFWKAEAKEGVVK